MAVINGTSNKETLYGTFENDTIQGYEGNDLIFGRDGGDTIYGDHGNDTLYGNGGTDWLYGGLGDDALDSTSGEYTNDFSGNDYLYGGQGNDSYYIDSAADTIVENTNEGTDSVCLEVFRSSIGSYILPDNVENLYSLNFSRDEGMTLTGNSLDNVIKAIGESGDTIYGLAGNDTLYGHPIDSLECFNKLFGGTGNDVYIISESPLSSKSDTITENVGEGVDTVYYNGYSSNPYVLPDNVENLYGYSEFSLNLMGNGLDNKIWGDTGDDVLNGSNGNDWLYGLEGNDALSGGIGRDYLSGGTGNDVLSGGDGQDVLSGSNDKDTLYGDNGTDLLNGGADNDYLYGGTGNDTLYGGDCQDILYGDAGNDVLCGGNGIDTYVFQEPTFGNDIIGPATNNNYDKIDLSAFTSSSASVSIGGSGGDDLIINIGDNTLTIADWNQGGGYQLNTFIFSDGIKSTNGTGWL